MKNTWRGNISATLALCLILGAGFHILASDRSLSQSDGSHSVGTQAPSRSFNINNAEYTFQTAEWAMSTGFISVPQARALRSRPKWGEARPDVPVAGDNNAAMATLAVVGLPVDPRHEMIGSETLSTFCLASDDENEGAFSLCEGPQGTVSTFNFGEDYRLCEFDDDCWHSTAATVIATGRPIETEKFSFEAISAIAFRDGTGNLRPKNRSFTSMIAAEEAGAFEDSGAAPPVVYPSFPGIYLSHAEVPNFFGPSKQELTEVFEISYDDYLEQRFEGDRNAIDAWLKMVEEYKALPKSAYPLVDIYTSEPDASGQLLAIPVLANKNILLTQGVRSGGPTFAFNVFSEIDDDNVCRSAGRQTPCVVTDINAQRRALEYVLSEVLLDASSGTSSGTVRRPRIGAVLIIAGGGLVDGHCNDTRTAEIISALRTNGVYTFVPAGNDGDPDRVRFPACVTDAITVGALDRAGSVMKHSNGANTAMVDLLVDGDTVVVPMRTPPVAGIAGCLPEADYRNIVAGYQKALNKLGFNAGPADGTIGNTMQAAIRAYQSSNTALKSSGRLDAATMQSISEDLERAEAWDVMLEYALHRQVEWSHLTSLDGYEQLLCKNAPDRAYYQAYFVGGTLVSASAAAGLFMRYLDAYPQVGTDQVMAAILKGDPSEVTSASLIAKDRDFADIADTLSSFTIDAADGVSIDDAGTTTPASQ
jgi:hypothetical protein